MSNSNNDYCLYVHRNKINGKRYFGISNNIRKRWCNNGKRYESCPRFWAAIKKYGWDNFAHIVLMTGLTLEEAKTKEIEFIARNRTREKEFGYNIDRGGNSGGSMLGKHHSIETRRKMRESALGRTVSEEQKRNHSERMKGLLVGARNGRSTSVICLNTGEVYGSQWEAAKATGCHQSKISLCCQGKRTHTHGYRWAFARG